jgi:hypothetical protein
MIGMSKSPAYSWQDPMGDLDGDRLRGRFKGRNVFRLDIASMVSVRNGAAVVAEL